MTSTGFRTVEHGRVLVSVKAMPFGWPTASLDADSGRDPKHGAEAGTGGLRTPKVGLHGFRGLPDCHYKRRENQ